MCSKNCLVFSVDVMHFFLHVCIPLPVLQVTTVCQRMLKEREEQIREDYDKVLASKLAGNKSISHN